MNPGDRLWFRAISHGYAFERDVPAVFVRSTPRRAVIRVALPDGSPKEIHVKPENLRPRTSGNERRCDAR